MSRFFSPASLATGSARHPWLVLALWVAIIAGSVMAAGYLKLNAESEIHGAESLTADQILEDKLRGAEPPGETVVVQSQNLRVDDPAYRAFVEDFVAKAKAVPGVLAVSSFYETGAEGLVNDDRSMTLVSIDLAGDAVDAEETAEPLLALIEATSGTSGFTLLTAGDGSINRDVNEAFEKDLQKAEIFGMPAALIVLIIVFGAVVAAGVPVILGALGILVAVGITALISNIFGMTSLVMNMITMIGLAVGIDYTLFIVERFREERRAGLDKYQAMSVASNTASRAVLFSGITVIIALAGMLIVPATDFQGMAIGAIAAVVAAVTIALTLLPAVLVLLDHRLNWLSLPGRNRKKVSDPNKGFFATTTRVVMKHPVVSVVASAVLLISASVPMFTMNLGETGLSEFPDDLESIHAFNVIDEEFSAGRLTPTEIVFDGNVGSPESVAAISRLRALLEADARFDDVSTLIVGDNGDAAVLTAIVDGESNGDAARGAIRDLRNDYIPQAFTGVDGVEVYVGGQSATTEDYVATMTTYLPIVIAFVLVLSFILLTMVFRSIVIPVKAIIMNLLSVGAAYGLIVLVFQEGIGADLLGFQQSDTINAFLPIFLFAVLFGLSMDYHVFLLTRIQEQFHRTGDNRAAVAHGLRSTAHIITGAAAIMMVVFGGFASGDMVPLQQTGFGLAVAVLLDATIVRSVLVPASMELLGAWNWYLPSWLRWLPQISVEGSSHPAPHAVPAPAHGADLELGYAPAGGK